VVSADIYNTAGGPTVLLAEIETGTRYRASAYATETDYGVVLADRVIWLPVDMLGEYFGRLTDVQRTRVINQIVAILRGH
jgi:mRNA-degrading endonuclease toxin of MazEF toxin-antitoxin module